MKQEKSNPLLTNIFSPYGLALISYSFFLFACLLPPSIYNSVIKEPDWMFLDPATILFYSICVIAFMTGAFFAGSLMPVIRPATRVFKTKISEFIFLLLPLVSATIFALRSDLKLVQSSPAILLLLFAQEGQQLKNTVGFEIQSNVTLPPLTLIGICWWAFSRYPDLHLRGVKKWVFLTLFLFAQLTILVSAIVTISRSLLMVGFCGLVVLYVTRKALRGELDFGRLAKGGMTIILCVSVLFYAFSFLRGSSELDDQNKLLFGYTIASYNRLAAMVNGRLHFPYTGNGIYLSNFFSFNKTFNRFIPINKLIGSPNPNDVFSAPFAAIARAGLDPTFVWPGAFGYIYSELGWFSCFFLLGYGMLYGVAWNWIRRGKVLGIILYPSFAFCALFWFGANLLLGSDSAVLFVLALCLAAYEFMLVDTKQARKTASVQNWALHASTPHGASASTNP